MFGLTWTLILLISQLGWSWTRQTRLRHSYVNGFWIHNRINPEFVFPDQLPRLKKQVRGFNPSASRPSSTQVPPLMVGSPSDNHPSYSSLPMPPSAPTDEVFVPVESCPGFEEEDGYCEKPRDYPDIGLIKSLVKNKTNIFGKIFDTLESPETTNRESSFAFTLIEINILKAVHQVKHSHLSQVYITQLYIRV